MADELVPRMAAPGFIAGMEAAGKAVGEATPEAVSAPALVMWGRKDRIVPLSSGRRLADAIPHARLVVLDDVAHCPMIEKPAETAALIAEFARDPKVTSQLDSRIPQWDTASGGEQSG
jgi:pimeloyl-ACP methyl ester carboxylesterase